MKLEQLIGAVREQLVSEYEKGLLTDAPRVHLAFMREPYMQLVLDGKKTIESRFSRNRIVPFAQVSAGDALIFKRSGGPITALAFVSAVLFKRKEFAEDWCSLRDLGEQIGVDASFWRGMQDRRFATLMWLADVTPLAPFSVEKNNGDRRGWIVLRDKQTQIGAPA